MKITNLKINYQINPLGIDLTAPVFSWLFEQTKGKKSVWNRFLLSDASDFSKVLFDSDQDDEILKGQLPYWAYSPEVSLQPGKTYYWKVISKDDAGNQAESAVQIFEGGHPAGSWTGKWITPAFAPELHPVFRRHFTLSAQKLQTLRKARAYVCGLGLYEMYINGEKVGNQYFAPYFTDYRYWAQHQTYDILPYLKEGENTVDIWLGNGWYKGRFGYLAGGQLRNYYGKEFKLLADLCFTSDQGTECIGTDETWQVLKSPVLTSGIYDGETYDARAEAILKKPSERDISMAKVGSAPAFKLMPMVGLPVTEHERRFPQALIRTPKGETVLDFGQEITGWVEFSEAERAGTRIVLEHGEILQDGCFYRDNLRTADAKFTYISAGDSREKVRPHFTYFGFRYVRVTGMSVSEKELKKFCAVSLYSDLEETGKITTGNDKINRLIANTKWSQKDNFLDIPTDCPQRDEREGWTGDAEIFADTASYHMETPVFFRKYLQDMAYEQTEKQGAVPYVVPDVLTVGRERMAKKPFNMSEDMWGEAGASVWGDAAVIIPWTMYLHYGSKRWLAQEYDNMTQWVDFIRHMDDTYCGGKRLWTCGFHFGDWLSLDVEGDTAGMNNREGGTDKYFVASVYYMLSAKLTAKAARILGKHEDAKNYEQLSKEVFEAIQKKYVTGAGELSIHKQTAYALAIHFGLFKAPEDVKLAGNHLVELVHLWKDHLATGFVGTGCLCEALTESGHADLAFKLLFNEDYPSWLYEVNLGATTIWERWNSVLPDGKISGTGMNSLNHYAYGCICGWIYRSVCGLNLTEKGVGGTKIQITPHVNRLLGFAKASVRFAAGIYESGWEFSKDGTKLTYMFSVPFGGEAEFVPDRPLVNVQVNGKPEKLTKGQTFSKGTYQITVDVNE